MLLPLDRSGEEDIYRASTAMLRVHESKDFLGGVIASLSIPWGFNKGDEDLGGYHLVWPRDLVETAGGFLAAGAPGDAIRVLHYLEGTQEIDGRWPQNMWLDGRPYWNGSQMDEAAFPVLLVDLLRRESHRRWAI
jgi:glucoamylase